MGTLVTCFILLLMSKLMVMAWWAVFSGTKLHGLYNWVKLAHNSAVFFIPLYLLLSGMVVLTTETVCTALAVWLLCPRRDNYVFEHDEYVWLMQQEENRRKA